MDGCSSQVIRFLGSAANLRRPLEPFRNELVERAAHAPNEAHGPNLGAARQQTAAPKHRQ